ncbi:helix-turn-helix domain-containing protein [Microbacterium plantarum]|uniref:helix-turn-helix domain-containing protein n=1 Tax=Microbacterium plantarum TaxID=1816425 RepID=UPI002B482741|nr:helix-turn-helix transcriptional regulator [Microbacterium plantarum]WRK16544.1 helix-turn-helix transcriptional regulator [Microbacterium plantarum]
MQIPDELINQTTANVLKGVMQESGLQQKSWAQKSGISPVTLQKLLSGKQAIKVPQLLALARASVLSPEAVMDRIDEAVQRAVSDAPISLDAHRAKKPAQMTDDEIDALQGVAGRDDELEHDQPEAP